MRMHCLPSPAHFAACKRELTLAEQNQLFVGYTECHAYVLVKDICVFVLLITKVKAVVYFSATQEALTYIQFLQH